MDADDTSRKAIIAATFLPLVKPEKMESFLTDWGKWFVLEDTHEDAKIPGKLKSKSTNRIYYACRSHMRILNDTTHILFWMPTT